MCGQVVAAAAFGNEGAQLYVFYGEFLGAYLAGEDSLDISTVDLALRAQCQNLASERPVIQTVFNVAINDVREIEPGTALFISPSAEVETRRILAKGANKACSFGFSLSRALPSCSRIRDVSQLRRGC
mgnify:CR=1 FL=1